MRLLGHENVAGPVVDALRAAGHDIVWVHEESPGLDDDAILRLAQQQQRIVLTFDKDFGELAFRTGVATYGVILVRLRTPSPDVLAAAVVDAIQSRPVWADRFTVIEAGRIRTRPLPKRTRRP